MFLGRREGDDDVYYSKIGPTASSTRNGSADNESVHGRSGTAESAAIRKERPSNQEDVFAAGNCGQLSPET